MPGLDHVKHAGSVLLLAASLAGCAEGETGLAFQEERYCRAALGFLADSLRLPSRVEADTIDDWRTRRIVPGRRIYASGATDIG